MWAAGISVVGDISNSALSVETKLKSRIFYHTFIESFGFHPSRADKAFDYALFVQQQFASQNLKCSVVPHSPYSVSQPLFEKIAQNAVEVNSIVCMHNQESEGEAEFFTNGTGAIATHISETLGIDTSHWNPTGQSSLVSVLKYLPAENPLLLVHNTFTTQADIDVLLQQRALENTFFVLCPNSNLYIENQLPPVELFRQNNLNICLGTDSLASNHQLSVLAEMIILQGNFPDIQLEELVNWACFNGAKALQVANRFGSFEPGRKPGVNLISGIDFKNMKLTEKSKVKRLV
jgi:cytosine/adenosine deaminase-related metal-dependent hydrolase